MCCNKENEDLTKELKALDLADVDTVNKDNKIDFADLADPASPNYRVRGPACCCNRMKNTEDE